MARQLLPLLAVALLILGLGSPRLNAETFASSTSILAEANPYEGLRESRSPWFVELWTSSWFFKMLVIGAVVAGFKAITRGNKSSTTQPTPRQNHSPTPTPPAVPVAQPRLWLYKSEGREVGSFDEATLRQLRAAGVISPSTSIRRSDGGNWITYGDVFGDN